MIGKIAESIGKRWSFCAEGYNTLIQKEFQGEEGTAWDCLLKEYAPETMGTALDIGSGPGFFAILLAKQGWKTTGIDCSEKMVERARKNVAELGIDA